jgi:hypothetical protein
MRWALLVLMAGLLVACGGDSDTSTATNTPGATIQSSSTATTPSGSTSPASTPATGLANATAGSGAITVSGAVEAELSREGVCGPGVLEDTYQMIISESGEGDLFWMLQVYVNKYAGPGEFEVTDAGSSYGATISIGDGTGAVWHSTADLGGTVVVDAEELTGSVDAELKHMNGGDNVHISGTWNCTKL